ncbi:MAG: ABC transporter permease [Planctomycetota bacterium]|nr:ABC transporter permease [Planctomycetota bacterium]
MVWTILQVSFRRLKNNRSELLLTFLVPILFFSIFALIFGSRGTSGTSIPKIKIALSDQNPSDVSRRAIELLREQTSLRITDAHTALLHADSVEHELARLVEPSLAEDLVRRGSVSAAVVFSAPTAQSSFPTIQLLADSYDQVSGQVLSALVQKSVMTAFAEEQRKQVPVGPIRSVAFAPASNPFPSTELPTIQSVDILGSKKTNPVIAMYAAGIAVMFLLFSATTASGSLLEERENSTLDRLLCSRLSMDQLLLGKWAYLTIVGMVQMVFMFSWGALVFGIDLFNHLEGFFAMTLVTAGASSSFALLLASMCKSRTQLSWISTIVILSMSALGGSMVPRYLMSESMQRAGMLTFNAWALEGYNKIFWRDLHLHDIELELGVLTLCGFCFIVGARLFAIRWERS